VEAAQQAAVEQARIAYRMAEVQFRAGAIDFLTVLETQRSLFQSEDTLVQTRLGRLVAAVALFRAMGGGWTAAAAS
jgi:outer membrane protein TolC